MTSFGAPQVLIEREVEAPSADRGEVLIEVEKVNLTFVETQVQLAALACSKSSWHERPEPRR